MAGDVSESEVRNWLHLIAAAWAADVDEWHDGGVTVRRTYGGANNALYRVEANGQSYAVKLCAPDDRRRAMREYSALRLLQAASLDIAPEPLLLDETCAIVPFPAVVYRWLPGAPLSGKPDALQLAALSETYHGMHSLKPGDFPDVEILDAVFHWFDFAPYVAELRRFMDDYSPWLTASLPGGGELRDRLARLVDDCTEALMAARVQVSRENVPLRLCRVDPNLGNTVWCEDGRLRWVDWEYSGWGDPALDLAELRWHGALERLSEPRHVWLRLNYRRPPDDPTFDLRLALWDRLLATRWPLLILRWLWSQDNGPDRVRLSQVTADPEELRLRLTRLVERAERFSGIRE